MRAVNLIPHDQRGTVSAAGRSGGGAYAVLAVLGGLALLALLYGIAAHKISGDQSKAAALSARASRAEAVATQLAPYTSFISVRESRMQAVSQLVGTRFDWAHSLHELGRVLPRDASISAIDGTVGSATATATASAASKPGSGSSSVASATPPGTVPTLTLNGCATSQGEVALVLQRLRLMDGVSEVKLASSTKSTSTSSAGAAPGSCAPGDPAFVATLTYDALPTPAPSAATTTLASNQGTPGASGTGGTR
jgi:Tfp pilus assembly protein PilN